jgi:hypothetical protein
MEQNMKVIKKRENRLAKDGAFRTLRDKKRGMKRRADEAVWSKKIQYSQDFPRPGQVRSTENEIFATKRTLPIPTGASAQAAAPTKTADTMRKFAQDLRTIVSDGPRTMSQATAILTRDTPGLKQLLRNAAITSTAFIDMFTEPITRNGRTISAT